MESAASESQYAADCQPFLLAGSHHEFLSRLIDELREARM
jgi:hypothetical protein